MDSTAEADTDRNALPQGTRIDEYVLETVLGSGGFGITYRARDQFGRLVAIKEYLPADLAVRDGDMSIHPRSGKETNTYSWGLERFRDEAQTLAQFKHPNIVQVKRYFEANNSAYMVMEYEQGENLTSLLDRVQVLTERELWPLLGPLLNGLFEVHRAGILHRDIKPDNIYIRTDGSALFLDFGAARQAVSNRSRNMTAVLTPPYAPIEQYGSHFPQGPWTDIYALGVVIYEALSGKRPPPSTDRNLGAALTPLDQAAGQRCSPQLLAGVDAALRVKGQDRPQNVPQWLRVLNPSGAPVSQDVPVAKTPAKAKEKKAGTQGWGSKTNRRVFFGVALIGFIGMVAALIPPSAESLLNQGQAADGRSASIRVTQPDKRGLDENDRIQAIAYYTKAIPGLRPGRAALAHSLRGDDYMQQKDIERAIEDYEAALALDSSLAHVNISLAGAYSSKAFGLSLEGKLDQALDLYGRALALHPDEFDFMERARVYRRKHQYQEAIDDVTEAINLNERPEQYQLRGDLNSDSDRPDQAIADYTKSLGLDPKSALAYRGRADSYRTKKLYDKAIADYGKSIQLNAEDVHTYNGRAIALEEKGLPDQAIVDFSKAIKLAPEDSILYSNRASAYLDKELYDKARADLAKAVQLDVSNAYAYFYHAQLAEATDDDRSAKRDYEKVLSLDPPAWMKEETEDRLKDLSAHP